MMKNEILREMIGAGCFDLDTYSTALQGANMMKSSVQFQFKDRNLSRAISSLRIQECKWH